MRSTLITIHLTSISLLLLSALGAPAHRGQPSPDLIHPHEAAIARLIDTPHPYQRGAFNYEHINPHVPLKDQIVSYKVEHSGMGGYGVVTSPSSVLHPGIGMLRKVVPVKGDPDSIMQAQYATVPPDRTIHVFHSKVVHVPNDNLRGTGVIVPLLSDDIEQHQRRFPPKETYYLGPPVPGSRNHLMAPNA